MKDIKPGYWLPRILALGFVLSLVLPVPKFLQSMDNGTYILWLARLTWVILVPVVFGAILLAIVVFRHK